MISGIHSCVNFKSITVSDKVDNDMVNNINGQTILEELNDKKKQDSDTFITDKKQEKPVEKKFTTKETKIQEKNNSEVGEVKENSIKKGVAKVSKFFVVSEEITKGIGKGTLGAAFAGAIGLTLSWFTSALPKGFKKGTKLAEPFKHPIKSMNKTHKIVTATVAALIFFQQLAKAILKSNQRKANIDHKLNIK